jgi:anaerobic selenocysteine-containing dehydrogenase
MEMLTAKDENGDYVIPKIIYSDAYSSEMVAYADLILPDTTYLERHDCISLLDRPISEPDMACDSIRWPVVEPDRDVRGFQTVLLDLGARLKLPGIRRRRGRITGLQGLCRLHRQSPAQAGHRPAFRLARRGRRQDRVGRKPNPTSSSATSRMAASRRCTCPEEAHYFKHANRAWSDWAIEHGLQDGPVENIFQLYLEPLRKFQLAAEGKAQASSAGASPGDRISTCFDPLPFWYPAV